MDVVILCGGKGTRLSEETISKPKPMVEIGDMPILWHIMKIYSSYGYKRFILALGYKADYIKQYFYNLRINKSDFTISMDPDSTPVFHNHIIEKDWEITFIDTGETTLKGGRIKRLEKYIQSDDFHLTYGDGVSNVNLAELVKFHRQHGKIATVTAVHPPSRFGEMVLDGELVSQFEEKPQMETGYINGGFFVLNKKVMNYLNEAENCDFEFGAIQQIVKDGQLCAYRHDGFWQPMDNIREKEYLSRLVTEKRAPWVKW